MAEITVAISSTQDKIREDLKAIFGSITSEDEFVIRTADVESVGTRISGTFVVRSKGAGMVSV